MKSREGFVSNSSSSSFIVAFPKKVGEMSVQDLQMLMFGETLFVELGTGEETSTIEFAAVVYRDAMNQNPVTDLSDEVQREVLLDAMMGGYFEGHPEMPDEVFKWENPKRTMAFEIYNMVVEATAGQRLKDFWWKSTLRWDQLVYYVFEYEDGAGSFLSFMEHGGIFDNLPHMRISKH